MNISKLKKKILNNTLIYGIGTGIQSLSAFVLIPIITLNVGIEGFGSYAILISLSTISAGVFYFGMTSALPRSYFEFDALDHRIRVFSVGLQLTILGALLQLILATIVYLFVDLNIFGLPPEHKISFLYCMISSSVLMINQYLLLKFRLDYRPLTFVSLNALYFFALIFYTFHLLDNSTNPLVDIFRSLLIVNSLFCIVIFITIGFKSIQIVNLLNDINLLKYMLVFGFFQIIASTGQALTETVDRFMLLRFFSVNDVGIYYSYSRLSALIYVMFCIPFSLVWASVSMDIMNSKNRDKIISEVFSMYLYLGYSFIILISIFSEDLFNFLIKGDIILFNFVLFSFMAVSSIYFGLMAVMSVSFFYDRKIHLLALCYYIALPFKILAFLALVPDYGITYLGVVSVLSSLVVLTCCFWLTRKGSRLKVHWKFVSIITFIFILLQGLLYFFQPTFNIQQQMVMALFILIVIYIFFTKFFIKASIL